MEFVDQLHRKITLNTMPKRIVSLVPSQTELLVDLGLEAQLVGVTKFCVHPKHLRKSKAVVGGTKNVHIDKIKALQPDIIICNKEENTKEMVTELGAIAPVWVSDIQNIQDCQQMIEALGYMFQKEQLSKKINDEIENAHQQFLHYIKAQPTKKVAYIIWKRPYMAAGGSTFIDYLLRLNNFENVFAPKDGRYPEVTIDEMKKAEVVLFSSEPYPFREKHIAKYQKDFPASQLLLVDGEYFSWYGSRLIQAFSYFKELRKQIN